MNTENIKGSIISGVAHNICIFTSQQKKSFHVLCHNGYAGGPGIAQILGSGRNVL